jgi:hypothetical protein
MTKSPWIAGLAAVAALAALAGCGGSGSSSTTTASPPPPSSTKAASGNKRLTAAQWQTYETANKTFLSVNSKGIAKYRACNQASSHTRSASALGKCLGDTIPKATAATHTFGATLHGFQPSVGGDCTNALNQYIGSLVSWTNVLAGINHAVQLSQLPSPANAQTAYNQIATSAESFVKACKPVG